MADTKEQEPKVGGAADPGATPRGEEPKVAPDPAAPPKGKEPKPKKAKKGPGEARPAEPEGPPPEPAPPPRLHEYYEQRVRPKLAQQFGFKNAHEIPKLVKIVLNVGMGDAPKNPKGLEAAVGELAAITGQHPVVTRAKKQMIFPEIDYDKVEKIHGMDITLVTTAGRDDTALALLRELGMPFRGEAPVAVA